MLSERAGINEQRENAREKKPHREIIMIDRLQSKRVFNGYLEMEKIKHLHAKFKETNENIKSDRTFAIG